MEELRKKYYAAVQRLPQRTIDRCRNRVKIRSRHGFRKDIRCKSLDLIEDGATTLEGWNLVGDAVKYLLRQQALYCTMRLSPSNRELIICGHVHRFLEDAGLIEDSVSRFPEATRIMGECFDAEGHRTYAHRYTDVEEFDRFHAVLGDKLWPEQK